jgi:hypothetical protein
VPIINFLIKMEVHNNFSPLAFRKKESKATYEKWYAFGKNYAIPASANTLIPFQFTDVNVGEIQPDSIEVVAVNQETGEGIKTGVYVSRDDMPEHGSALYVSPGKNSFSEALPQGTYRAEFTIGTQVYISTPFCVIPGIETSSKYLLIEYWNDEKIAYPGGFITTGANNDFKYQMYVPATICKPKYEFEEELTKRAGYKFLELQTSTKVYAFTFVAPEFICDAMRLIRLSDYIRISHDGEYYNALNFEFDVDWQEQLYLAAVDCQFETDSIIQKLPSFNRRDKASFYNALLANIDTPIMFSPDIVGLYYKEYRETEPVVKGKLIRELSPIDLIDENTTIAVDLGTGEARKFNLYRMLQDYISKTHEDATDFLLHLRGGATFGEGVTGSAASINAVGDAEVQGLNARVTKVKSLDSEDYVTVNKTAFTVNKQGDTALNALNARGDSHLQQDVYTGNNTGKITKEGQLQYLSAIIYEFLSSETFVPGFLGEGFKIWLENSNWHIECDNLTVRQTMNIFELLIQKIRSVNGAIVVSQSSGKVTSVEDTGTQYKITFGEEFPTFQEGDLIRCQSWSKNALKFYWVEVKTAADGYVLCDKSEFNNVVPAVGDEVVQMGNTKNTERQALIYITAQESGKPYIEILNGVKTKSLTGTDRTRLGDLSNIVDPDFTGEAAVKGTGFYSTNAFLKGIFVLRNGKRVEDEIKIAKDAADQAAQDAANAAQSAQEAKDRLNKWADDGLISPTEKPALVDEGKRIQAEYLQIKANADKYGVSVTEYTEAYNNYLNELRYHSATTPENIVVRPELAQSQTAYYDKRNGALNAIATASKEYVDNADKKLKEYLDTEITAIPGKIELAVQSLKTANYNLLLDSNHTLSENPYQLGSYKYDVHLVKGKSYTLTVCYKCADSDDVVAYNNPSLGYLVILPKSAEETIVSTKITPSNDDAAYFYFYKAPQKETTQTYVKWAVITEGDIGVAAWIPSRTEAKTGIRNLFPISRMQTATNKHLNYFDITGWVATVYSEEEFKSRFKPSTKYTITGKYTILGKPTSGTGYKDSIVAFCMWNNSNLIDLWRKMVEYEVVGASGEISNTFTTPSNLDGYKIVVYTMYNTGNLGEFRFTDLMVSEGIEAVGWTQAPEDIEYDYRKYTDTQILAVDGKIELSVTTQLNKRVIGGSNLLLKSDICVSEATAPKSIIMSKYWRELAGKKISISFDYEYSNLVLGGSQRIGLEAAVLKDGTSQYYYIGVFKNFDSTSLKADSGRFVNTVTVPNDILNNESISINVYIQVGSGSKVKMCNFQIEICDTATGWKPAPEDGIIESKEYTNSQISVVEGKITSTVEKINTVDGKVTGLASRVTQTEQSITSVVGDINALNNTTDRHITKQVDLTGWDNNKFFPLVIQIPTYYKTKVVINRPLHSTYGKPSYGTHDAGFSMNLSFEMSGSGWGSLPEVTNIFDYTRAWSTGPIVVDLGQITKTSTCVMGIRGGSKYDVTVHDTTDPNVINVYQTDYHGSYDTSFPVRTDGTEPVRTYGYYTEIKQERDRITATAAKVDEQGNRLSAAELTLSADHAKLSVVEQAANSANSLAGAAQSTANAANSLAGTANNKAEAADGRVTATQNGLVETGINITSRKIVLKSDNVLFQNNAGQQTVAINANGKLTANSIEVGEVVAGGFAAQRITTGNLTVTDGAVIGGMTIAGGVLTGKAINIQDGAKIGNFTIESGILSANGMVAGMQMRLSNNLMEISSSGLRIDHNSGGYAVNVTGNGRCYMQGVESYRKFGVYEFAGATQWKAPGVHFACVISSAAAVRQKWGNPSIGVSASRLSTGRYTVRFTGVHSQGFIPMVMALNATKWVNVCVEDIICTTQFTVKLMDVNTGMIDSDFAVYICGFV